MLTRYNVETSHQTDKTAETILVCNDKHKGRKTRLTHTFLSFFFTEYNSCKIIVTYSYRPKFYTLEYPLEGNEQKQPAVALGCVNLSMKGMLEILKVCFPAARSPAPEQSLEYGNLMPA